MLKVKSTVRPRSLVIAAAAINAAQELGLPGDVLITSGNDGKHMTGSKHYTDEALDLRTKHIGWHLASSWATAIKRRLGGDYQVLLEDYSKPNEHLHVEYDPPKRKKKR